MLTERGVIAFALHTVHKGIREAKSQIVKEGFFFFRERERLNVGEGVHDLKNVYKVVEI